MAIKSSSPYQLSYKDQAIWERGDLSLAGVTSAWKIRRDPRLAEYIVKLIQLDPALPEDEAKRYQDAFGYQGLMQALRPWTLWQSVSQRCDDLGVSLEFGEMRRGELRRVIAEVHRGLWAQVEENRDALPDRLKLDALLLEMWNSDDAFTRSALLTVMAEMPLKYGPWRAMKRIFKESAAQQDWEMFGVIAARLDREGDQLPRYLNRSVPQSRTFKVPYSYDNRDVSKGTVAYLVRRAWRVLRQVAQDQPGLYPEVAAEVLKHYQSSDRDWHLSGAWLRNHILYHESKRYHAETFRYNPRSHYGEHAYPTLWQRNARPLLRLLEEAQNGRVLSFVTSALVEDFKSTLSELGADWVKRVSRLRNAVKDAFLHRWYTEICPHTQADYAQLGLNEPLFALLWSPHSEMSSFAQSYFQAHPEALLSLVTVDRALALTRSPKEQLRSLGQSLLDPQAGHFTLTLDQWTSLLTDERSFEFASSHVKTLFSGKDLSYAWYIRLINHEYDQLSSWAMSLLKESAYQPIEGDLFSFYWSLLTPSSWRTNSARTALEGLANLPEDGAERLLNRLSTSQLSALLLHPEIKGHQALQSWVNEGWIKPSLLGARWLRDLLDRELWRSGQWQDQLGTEGEDWRDNLSYPDKAASIIQGWLLSPSYFSSEEVGAWWLLQRGLENSWSMRAYRTYMERHLPIADFAALEVSHEEATSTNSSSADGLNAILAALDAPHRGWNDRDRLRSVMRQRMNAFVQAKDPNAPPLADHLVIGDELLTFNVFHRLAFSTDEANRALALQIGELCYQRWTEEAPLSFDKLLPFFSKGFPEIQAHLLKAMSATPLSAEARIDVRLPQFDPEGLYSFCFSHRAQVRDLGLSLIGEHPDRFADPERISLLVESSDRRVCEGVVKLLWEKLRDRPITTPWKPHPQSVSPRSSVAKRQVEVVDARPPSGKRPDQLKGKKFLGEGVSASAPLPSENLEWVAAFLRRTLFRLSPTHPLKDDLGRLTHATPSWRNKVNLIKAIRDLAVRDQAFAELVRPILEEFMTSRGQSERAACLVALTRMRHAYPELFTQRA